MTVLTAIEAFCYFFFFFSVLGHRMVFLKYEMDFRVKSSRTNDLSRSWMHGIFQFCVHLWLSQD